MPSNSHHVPRWREMLASGSPESPLNAVAPSATIVFGLTNAIWRRRYGMQTAISSGVGVRFCGGRHLMMFAMKTSSRR